jgi:hypothetical protein
VGSKVKFLTKVVVMTETKIKNLLYLLILIVVVAVLLGFSANTINSIVDLFVRYVLIGAILSLFVGTLVEQLTGDTLKRIALNIKIKKISFSISVFAIVVLILKFFIFRV